MTNKAKKNTLLMLFITVFVVLLCSLKSTVSLLFAICIIIYLMMMAYCIIDLPNRLFLFFFLLSFFLFIIGGEITSQYMNYEFTSGFSTQINNHAYLCCSITLLGFWIGDIVGEKSKVSTKRRILPENNINSIKKVSCLFLWISFFPCVLRLIEAGRYVAINGYASYYSTYESSLPVLVVTISQMFPIFMFIFLASLPEKKECILPLFAYIAYGALGLYTGRRLLLGVSIMVSFFYIMYRHFMDRNENWLTRKKLLFYFLAAFAIVCFLYSFKYFRYGKDAEAENVLEMLIGFFNQQGVTIDVVKYQKLYDGDDIGITSLYYTFRYARISVLTHFISGFPKTLYETRSVDSALLTNSLADYIMYRINAKQYLLGYGLGTSYVAELFHDFGYFGLSIFSFIYGFLFKKLYYPHNKHTSFWKTFFILLMLEKVVVLPRYGADYFITPFYNLANDFIIIVFIIVSSRSSKKGDIANDKLYRRSSSKF